MKILFIYNLDFMIKKYQKEIRILLMLGWLLTVLFFFFQGFPISKLPEVFLNGLAGFVLLVFFTALGRYVLKHFKQEWDSFLEEFCFSFGIGSGLVILLIIGLAFAQLLFEVLIVSIILVLFILVYRDARYLCIKAYKKLLKFTVEEKTVEEKIFIFFVGFSIILTLIAALTPPFFYDALSYHLAVPHKYLMHNGFSFLPLNYLSNYPANLGMLFVLAFSFSGDLLAKLISWLYFPLTALTVYSFSKSFFGKRMGIISATVFVFVPGVMILSTLTSIDMAVTFYSFLSLYALLRWCKFPQMKWFIFSGIFCGLAVGTKYTAILVTWFTLEMIVFIHVYFVKKKSFVNGLKHCIYFGLLVLLCFSPWLIKNIVYTGDPLYPFLSQLFKSSGSHFHNYSQVVKRIGNPVHKWFYTFMNNEASFLEGLKLILTSPWRITMTTNGAAGKTGVIFLLGLPFLFFIKRTPLIVRYLLFFSVCVFLGWVLLLPWMLRFAFPMFPPLSILVAYAFCGLSENFPQKKWAMIGISVILVYHLFLFSSEMVSILRPFSYFFSSQSKEEFLVNHGVNYFPVVKWANSTIPKDSKILFIGELRGYYCERDYLMHVAIEGVDEKNLILRNYVKESKDVGELLGKLEDLGITHILVNFPEMARLAKKYLFLDFYFEFRDEEKTEIFKEFSTEYLQSLISKNNVTLYKINYPPSSISE
jgi:hypothetical protein